MHAAHGGDEGVVLRHVADQAAHLARVRADVAAQDAGGAGRRLVEAQQRVDQGGFPGAVGAQQADGAAGERGLQLLEDDALAEAHLQAVELDYRVHYLSLRFLEFMCSKKGTDAFNKCVCPLFRYRWWDPASWAMGSTLPTRPARLPVIRLVRPAPSTLSPLGDGDAVGLAVGGDQRGLHVAQALDGLLLLRTAHCRRRPAGRPAAPAWCPGSGKSPRRNWHSDRAASWPGTSPSA